MEEAVIQLNKYVRANLRPGERGIDPINIMGFVRQHPEAGSYITKQPPTVSADILFSFVSFFSSLLYPSPSD